MNVQYMGDKIGYIIIMYRVFPNNRTNTIPNDFARNSKQKYKVFFRSLDS